jgi:ribonuclease HI
MLQSRTTLISLHKVKAHTNITSNEMVDTLAKNGRRKPHSPPIEPHAIYIKMNG